MEPNTRTILIIGLVWPEPNSSAAGRRMMQLISIFKSWSYKVIFASTALENEINFDLNTINVEKQKIELNADSFDDFLQNCSPTLVLFDRFVTEEQFGWRVSKNCPDAIKVLDSEDLHCLRYTRQSNLKNNIPFVIENLFDQEITIREIASILRCDLTLIIAEFEIELLTTYFKIDATILHYLPILFTETELNLNYLNTNFSQREDFMFIGNFWHEPNWDAVLHLKKTIWPEIRKHLPKAIIRIYGAYPSQKVFDLQNKKEGFLVLGRAENAQIAISKARILIAPLRFGAGIKGKLIEAMQFGTPSVTTSIGAESINGSLDWNGFISDDFNEIASKAVQLYENEMLWMNAQENGYAILKKRFQLRDFEPDFNLKIEYLRENLSLHRKSNFLGALLNHHSMKSTEYMSRWIQEKNNKK
ncbi:glycosyltransferase [Flavobacterium antarcticum]|uniref:glycosyltransferase n=1 Tax=Flavobacterium antarcticum TaxID=271155 RepID=UPI0003B3DA8F|nr:glycosyltransferase [Flavobacterium antarcticum]